MAKKAKANLITATKTKVKKVIDNSKQNLKEIKEELTKQKAFIKTIRIIKSQNYAIQYAISGDTLRLYDLRKRKKTNITELRNIFEDVKAVARQNKCKEIRVNTWLFVIHPLLKEKLGFKITEIHRLQKKELDLKRTFENLLIKKIIKEDASGNLWVIRTNGKKKRFPFFAEDFPEYVLPLWY